MKSTGRLPDFAGVALVDILANGLAMLIIVIVLSIAARAEREERTSAQVEEVETMMSRRFSTSLVLNSLAASPPARLHDYRASPLDQTPDPLLLPIIELHRNFVREYHSGAIWRREELLREPNVMDAWLEGFDEDRKLRLRTDVYDIAQFYLTMSILRDHSVVPRHWHFLSGGGLGVAGAGHCPPGVAAQDCVGVGSQGSSTLPTLTEGAGGGGDGDAWLPPGLLDGGGGGAADAAPFPGGASLDAGVGGGDGIPGDGLSGGGAGSFPNARPGQGNARGLLGGIGQGQGQGQGEGETRFRLSSPDSLRQDQGQQFGGKPPTTEQILTVLLAFLSKLQATLDAGASPSAQLANFEQSLQRALAAPPVPDQQTQGLIDNLMAQVMLPFRDLLNELHGDALSVIPLTLAPRARTALIIPTNRRLRSVTVGRAADQSALLPETARPVLRLNAHPDIWRGLSLPLEQNAILLMPTMQQQPETLRWRAVAYIAPEFNDFIIGFAYATIDQSGRLAVSTEDNQVRLDSRSLNPPYQAALFGARSWLVALYVGLVLGLLGLLLARQLTMRRLA